MPKSTDSWYVRLPDGRVLRAENTRAVRHHLGTGRVPLDSRVRRRTDEEWVGLEWAQEFADLVQEHRAASQPPAEPSSLDFAPAAPARQEAASGIAARLDPLQLQTVGVRGYVEDLVAALDSTLVRGKLVIALAAAFLAGLVTLFVGLARDLVPAWQLALAAGLAVLPIVAVSNCLLTQMSFVELCRLRPARWREARHHLVRNVVNLILVYLIVVGVVLAAVYGLRRLPVWLLTDGAAWPADPGLREALVSAVSALAVVLEVALWPVLILALLLAPVVVVEECWLFTALGLWLQLLRRHFSRAVLYEALAILPAVLATAALLVPVELAVRTQAAGLTAADTAPGSTVAKLSALNWVVTVRDILQGLAVAPMLAFLAVANVFIYLNLRYEQEPRRK